MICFRSFLLAACLVLSAIIAAAQWRQLDGGWVLTSAEDPPSYEVIASVSKESEDTIKDEYATGDVRPELAFGCTPGNEAITVQIDWQRFVSSFNTEVGFGVDGGRMLWQKWGVDQSNTITTSKNQMDSQALIDRLTAGSELSVEVTPYSGSPVTVRFDLAGLSRALDALRAECR